MLWNGTVRHRFTWGEPKSAAEPAPPPRAQPVPEPQIACPERDRRGAASRRGLKLAPEAPGGVPGRQPRSPPPPRTTPAHLEVVATEIHASDEGQHPRGGHPCAGGGAPAAPTDAGAPAWHSPEEERRGEEEASFAGGAFAPRLAGDAPPAPLRLTLSWAACREAAPVPGNDQPVAGPRGKQETRILGPRLAVSSPPKPWPGRTSVCVCVCARLQSFLRTQDCSWSDWRVCAPGVDAEPPRSPRQ